MVLREPQGAAPTTPQVGLQVQEESMGRIIRAVGAASIVAAPLAIGIGDQVRMSAEGGGEQVGVVQEWGQDQAVAQVSAIAEHSGQFAAASWLFLLGALLTIPALLGIWSISVGRSSRWAWTGAVLAMLGVIGQVVHLALYFALQQAYAAGLGGELGYEVDSALEQVPFAMVIFMPFFLSFLAPIPQSIGLRRARVVPLWAVVALIAGVMAMMLLGSTPVTSLVWTALTVAGFAPAAVAFGRGTGARPSIEMPASPAAAMA
jgi:hypothetical protein